MRPPYGANCLVTIGGVSYAVMESSELVAGEWIEILNGPVSLRCWWAKRKAGLSDIASKSSINRVYIVLPEVFGVNAWVRSVADRLAAHGHPALAVPLFARTAPDLELATKRPIWLKVDATRTPPPPIRFLVMSLQRSAGCEPVTNKRPSMWWVFASEGMPLFWRRPCPELRRSLIFTAQA